MKATVVVASYFCVILSAVFGPCARAEPVAEDKISFSLPFETALADKLKPGLNVVLVGKKICKTRTGTTFTHDTGNREFQATYLLTKGKCDPKNANVAVMGADPDAIGVVSPQEAQSAVPKDIELKARRLLLARDAAGPKDYSYAPLSRESPKTFTVKEGVLLHFNWKDEDNGPSVWVAKDSIFLLPGQCKTAHRPFILFTIDDRLYLAYRSGGCCRCGHNILYVYGLSESKPKKLYENGKLAD